MLLLLAGKAISCSLVELHHQPQRLLRRRPLQRRRPRRPHRPQLQRPRQLLQLRQDPLQPRDSIPHHGPVRPRRRVRNRFETTARFSKREGRRFNLEPRKAGIEERDFRNRRQNCEGSSERERELSESQMRNFLSGERGFLISDRETTDLRLQRLGRGFMQVRHRTDSLWRTWGTAPGVSDAKNQR